MSDKYTQNILDQIDSLEYQLEQYQSLVKTVDPDNLPKGEVLVFYKNEIINGFLELRGDTIFGDVTKNSKNDVVFQHLTDCFILILEKNTKYIEQKDLIKLFKGDMQC